MRIEVFRGFPQPLYGYSMFLSRLGHDRFLPHASHFINFPTIRRYIFLDADSTNQALWTYAVCVSPFQLLETGTNFYEILYECCIILSDPNLVT
jgi:hypothetical protein